jgi:hypothetical protein
LVRLEEPFQEQGLVVGGLKGGQFLLGQLHVGIAAVRVPACGCGNVACGCAAGGAWRPWRRALSRFFFVFPAAVR